MKKMYKSGVLVGRFQTVHKGHEMMINTAIGLCETVSVFVGSSNESRTYKNPFTYEERKEMLKTVFGDGIGVFPLPDIGVGNNPRWGDYVIENIKKQTSVLPDLIISGKEARRSNWFDSGEADKIGELFVAKTIDISASEMRDFIIENNFDEWKKYTSSKLWYRFSDMREIILLSKENKQTNCI